LAVESDGVIGIVAPEGLAGEAVLDCLANMSVRADEVLLLDSAPDAAARVGFGATRLAVHDLAGVDFATLAVLLIPEPAPQYPETIRRALTAECRVVAIEPDEASACLPPQPGLELIPSAARLVAGRLALNAGAAADIDSVDAVALDPASVGGKGAVERLAHECAQVLNARAPEADAGDVVRAFNTVLDGTLRDDVGGVPLRLTRVGVPVFFGQALICHLHFTSSVNSENLITALGAGEGVDVRTMGAMSSVRDGIDHNGIEVVIDSDRDNAARSHQLWVVMDNLRVQAEALAGRVH